MKRGGFYVLLIALMVLLLINLTYNVLKTNLDLDNIHIIKGNLFFQDQDIYVLDKSEQKKWEIYNNGTYPVSTTNGLNNAIKWANRNDYKTIYIPKGEYLVAKGDSEDDKDARINLISNMKIVLDEETILRKEENMFQGYSIFYLGGSIDNVEIIGGTLIGDRETHDYSIDGTHEWGHAILIKGASNVVINGVKMMNFTGDGVEIQGSTLLGGEITEKNLKNGTINSNDSLSLTSGNVHSDKIYLDDPLYKEYNNIYMWLPTGIEDGSSYNIYYYNQKEKLLKADIGKQFYQDESIIPDKADYFIIGLSTNSIKDLSVSYMTIDIPENIIIKNCDISNNRRQGISVVGANKVFIEGNKIHKINGTPPESGIDVEPGFFPANNIIVKNNKLENNNMHVILTYGGKNAVIKNNYFGFSKSMGLDTQEFSNVLIQNNKFEESGLSMNGENVVAINNKFIDSGALIEAEGGIFKNATLIDSSLSIGNDFNQLIQDVTIYQNSKFNDFTGIYVGEKTLSLKDVTIYGSGEKANNAHLILGVGSDANTYENLRIYDKSFRGTELPSGTYSNSIFEAGEIRINRAGKFNITNATFKGKDNLILVESTYGAPDITINHSIFTLSGNIGYGAAIYVTEAKSFNLINSTINIINNEDAITPVVKIGVYGDEGLSRIDSVTIKGNEIISNDAIHHLYIIDTKNAGINAPSYIIENNIIYNGELNLKENDFNLNNQLKNT